MNSFVETLWENFELQTERLIMIKYQTLCISSNQQTYQSPITGIDDDAHMACFPPHKQNMGINICFGNLLRYSKIKGEAQTIKEILEEN